jgi:hypothetical protein
MSVPVIAGLTESLSVADDRILLANWTPPRQEVQRDHPGSALSLASGSAIKRITAGVKARRGRPCQSLDLRAGPSPSGKVNFDEKRILLSIGDSEPLTPHWPVIFGHSDNGHWTALPAECCRDIGSYRNTPTSR